MQSRSCTILPFVSDGDFHWFQSLHLSIPKIRPWLNPQQSIVAMDHQYCQGLVWVTWKIFAIQCNHCISISIFPPNCAHHSLLLPAGEDVQLDAFSARENCISNLPDYNRPDIEYNYLLSTQIQHYHQNYMHLRNKIISKLIPLAIDAVTFCHRFGQIWCHN